MPAAATARVGRGRHYVAFHLVRDVFDPCAQDPRLSTAANPMLARATPGQCGNIRCLARGDQESSVHIGDGLRCRAFHAYARPVSFCIAGGRQSVTSATAVEAVSLVK